MDLRALGVARLNRPARTRAIAATLFGGVPAEKVAQVRATEPRVLQPLRSLLCRGLVLLASSALACCSPAGPHAQDAKWLIENDFCSGATLAAADRSSPNPHA